MNTWKERKHHMKKKGDDHDHEHHSHDHGAGHSHGDSSQDEVKDALNQFSLLKKKAVHRKKRR